MDERIVVRSRWTLPGSPCVVRVMAIGEGWVMYRFKNAMPAVLYWKDFVKKFEPAAECGGAAPIRGGEPQNSRSRRAVPGRRAPDTVRRHAAKGRLA